MRIMAAATLAMLISTTGCAAPAAKSGDSTMVDCDATSAQSLIGKRKSETLGKEAMQRTTTNIIRWIAPGQPVSMDYRTDRLNIEVDEREIVIGISCG